MVIHIFFFFLKQRFLPTTPPGMQNLIQEVICSFVGWKKNLVYAGLNQWNLLWLSLLLWLKSKLHCGACEGGCARALVCMLWGASRDSQTSRIFFKADNATAVSVRIQITNKCWTLLTALYTLSWVEHTIFWTYDDSLFILLETPSTNEQICAW